jgi:transposase
MSGKRYSEEFKREAVKQINEGGYALADEAGRLGTASLSLYSWHKKYGHSSEQASQPASSQPKQAAKR